MEDQTTEKKTPAPKKAAKPKAPATSAAVLAKIAELEAKVAAGEEAALQRVCKAMGIDPKAIEAAKPAKPEPQITCFVGTPVHINGNQYLGKVTVPYGVFEMLQEMLGKRRQRLLRELTGNNYILKELQSGGMAPVLVGQVDEVGDKISGQV